MAAFGVRPLEEAHPFGAIVTALDLADIAAPEVAQALRKLWIDKGPLIFPRLAG